MTAKTKKAEREKHTAKVRNVADGDKEDKQSPKKKGPQKDWSDAVLKKYGLERLDDAARHEGSALLALALAGEAFAIVRDRLKPKHAWTAWLKNLGVRRQRAWTAIKVYEGAASAAAELDLTVEEVLAGKSYTQAMAAWARAEPQARDEEDGPTPNPRGRDDHAPQSPPAPPSPPAPRGQDEDDQEEDEDDQEEDEDEPAVANGDIQIADGKATVTAEVLGQVSSVDGSRPLLVARNWDARARDALARGVAVLLMPELDERCRPPAREDAA
jgi:hypothetical protein